MREYVQKPELRKYVQFVCALYTWVFGPIRKVEAPSE